MIVDDKTVDKIAHLARLELSENQSAKMKDDMNAVLGWMEKLNELDTDSVEPLIHMSHELNVLRSLADSISVMYRGRIVEEGGTEIIFNNAKHPYTKSLLEAIPSLNPHNRKRREFISSDEIEMNIPKFSINDVKVNNKSDKEQQLIQINENHYVEGVLS